MGGTVLKGVCVCGCLCEDGHGGAGREAEGLFFVVVVGRVVGGSLVDGAVEPGRGLVLHRKGINT